METQRPTRVAWINGAFGAGKTTAARLLAESIPGAVVFDPEHVGSAVRVVLQPVSPVEDFQDGSAWRTLVAASINSIARELPPEGPRLVVVPQTVTNPTYWLTICEALDVTIKVTGVVLQVSTSEHRRRVENDLTESGAREWRLAKFDRFRLAAWLQTCFTPCASRSITSDRTTTW